MKKIMYALLSLMITGAYNVPSLLAAPVISQQIQVLVNAEKVHFPDQKPKIVSNTVLVPLRFVSDKLGGKLQLVGKEITIVKGDRTVKLVIGANTATVNGKTVTLGAAADAEKGRTYVPLRFISNGLGEKVEWDQKNMTVWLGKKSKGDQESPNDDGEKPIDGNNGETPKDGTDIGNVAPTNMGDDKLYPDYPMKDFAHYFGDNKDILPGYAKNFNIRIADGKNYPLLIPDRGGDANFDTIIYELRSEIYNGDIERYKGKEVVKMRYSGLNLGISFLTEDMGIRYRNAFERSVDKNGIKTAVFVLKDSYDKRKGFMDWDKFEYKDILYFYIQVSAPFIPLVANTFGR